jgi:hypothetical protein
VTYDRDFWEERWSEVPPSRATERPPNTRLSAEVDLASWSPQPGHFDLVACLYVHVAGSVEEMVRRMAAGVAPGGTQLLVGHHPAGNQVQVSVREAVAALDPDRWEIVIAEERPRAAAGTGGDAVVRARNDGADD